MSNRNKEAGRKRWDGISKEDRIAHIRKMVEARVNRVIQCPNCEHEFSIGSRGAATLNGVEPSAEKALARPEGIGRGSSGHTEVPKPARASSVAGLKVADDVETAQERAQRMFIEKMEGKRR